MVDTPQKENGFTPIANEIMEALMKVNLSAYESRVLWFLFRKTYGWSKKTDWITLSQFSECIGLDRRLIHRAIKSLSSKKMIVIYKDDTFKIRYGFQKDYRKWKLSSKKMTVINRDDNVSSKEMIEVSSIQIPTKETITKETKQKKRKRNKMPIPDNFIISDRVKKWAQVKGFTKLEEHLESFKLSCAAKGYEYVDWDSAFMKAITDDWGRIRQGDKNGTFGKFTIEKPVSRQDREQNEEAERINREYREAKAREAAGEAG